MRPFSFKLKSPTGFGPVGNAILLALFVVSAVIAAFSTYMTVTETDRSATVSAETLKWLLVGNLALILVLAGMLFLPIWRLFQENRSDYGSARLRLRLIALFGFTAMIPTVVVAGFLGVLINRSVEVWFSETLNEAVESASDVAEASQDAIIDDLLFDASEAALNLDEPEFVEAYISDPQTYRVSLVGLSNLRNLHTLMIINGEREVVMEYRAEDAPDFIPPSETNWIAARNGRRAVYVNQDLVVSVLMRLKSYDDAYVYAARRGPETVKQQLTAIEEGLSAYREADSRKNELRFVFLLAYLEAALLVLLSTAWLGMSAARRIATPIGRLASAARSVRDGDLTVRLVRPGMHDEIDDLTEAFNQMTMRLLRQTRDLERSRADAESRSNFIEAVLESVEAGVIRVDPAFKVTIANASAARILDVDLEKLNASALIDSAPDFLPSLRLALESGESQGANLRRQTEDGPRDVHVRMAPEPCQTGCVITFHDTTRLAAGQRQAAWRDVARRIAHEIRNPLTPIQLSTERIRRRFGPQIENDAETFEKCIETILRQVNDIGRMVEEFSAFARMPKPVFSEFDVCELVRNVCFARKLASPRVAVGLNLPRGVMMAKGDDRLLGQALTNVIKNACEAVERHMDDGVIKKGNVTITLEEIHGQKAHLIVADTGPGFPVEGREKLLEPYVTTRDTGVGLGLAIVNRIVEDHGGILTLGDNSGGGARVDIVLPLLPLNLETDATSAEEGVL